MSSKTFAITLNGVEYIMSAREVTDIAEVVTGITPAAAVFTGSAIEVKPKSEKVLVEGTDYSITYSDNVSIGECEVVINGKGYYFGKATYSLTITPEKNEDIEDSEEETEEIPEKSDSEDSEEEVLLEDTESDASTGKDEEELEDEEETEDEEEESEEEDIEEDEELDEEEDSEDDSE